MNCKSILIKSKRSRSSFQNTLNQRKNSTNTHSQGKNWQNSLISLSKILSHLNDDTLKRYNTQADRYASQNTPNNKDENLSRQLQSKNNNKWQRTMRFQSLQPEPWLDENELKNNPKQKRIQNVSKSFHISLLSNSQMKNKSNKFLRSSSSFDNLNPNSLIEKQTNTQRLNNSGQENQALLTQNFTYTNEQKAKVSMQFLVHEQKHKKMQKLLKYKRHLIDKTGLKQQKINQHSKYLVQMLKKLSVDNLYNISLAEFGKGINKKNSLAIQGNAKVNSFHTLQKQVVKSQKTQIRSSSCCELNLSKQSQVKLVRKISKLKCSVKEIQAEFHNDLEHKEIDNYKVAFKPRRNWIFEKRASSCSQKILKPSQVKAVPKKSQKQLKITNHFLKISRVKV